MKTTNTILLGILIVITLACGYSSKNTTAGTSMPAIANLSPRSTNAGDPAFMLTVNGSNFASNAVVNWNSAAQATTFVNGAQVTIAVPAAAVSNAGTIKISVTNPAVSGSGMYGGSPAQTSSTVNFVIN